MFPELAGGFFTTSAIWEAHIGLGWALNPVSGVLIGREKDIETHARRRPCEDGGGGWSDAVTNQGTPSISSSHWKLKRQGRFSPRAIRVSTALLIP